MKLFQYKEVEDEFCVKDIRLLSYFCRISSEIVFLYI